MPRKKSNIGRSTRHARQLSTRRGNESPEEREARRKTDRIRASASRAAETSQQHGVRIADLRARASISRAAVTPTEREADRLRKARSRTRITLKKSVFNYNEDYDCKMHHDVVIGPKTILCFQCRALKFQKETPDMCCSNNAPLESEHPKVVLRNQTFCEKTDAECD